MCSWSRKITTSHFVNAATCILYVLKCIQLLNCTNLDLEQWFPIFQLHLQMIFKIATCTPMGIDSDAYLLHYEWMLVVIQI